MADDVSLNRYFERIGFTGSIAPTMATLEQIVALQAATIPHESFGAVLGEPHGLDQASLEARLVSARRGGTAFELNTLLMRVLQALEFEVECCVASRLVGRDVDAGAPLDHMVLLVEVAGAALLVDAGLGALTPTGPLRLEPWVEQATAHEPCRLIDIGDARFDVELLRGGDWLKLLRFSPQPVEFDMLATMHEALSSGPDSPLRAHLVAGLAAPELRHDLRDGLAIDYPLDGEVTIAPVESPAQMRDILAATFGIILPAGEDIDAALAARLPPPLEV